MTLSGRILLSFFAKHFYFISSRMFRAGDPSAIIGFQRAFQTSIGKRDHLGCNLWLSINQSIQFGLVYCLSMYFEMDYTLQI